MKTPKPRNPTIEECVCKHADFLGKHTRILRSQQRLIEFLLLDRAKLRETPKWVFELIEEINNANR